LEILVLLEQILNYQKDKTKLLSNVRFNPFFLVPDEEYIHMKTCPKAKPQVSEIEKLYGTAKSERNARAGINSLSL